MNISAKAVANAAERDGAPADDRPQYVDEALKAERRVGWREGKPLVPHPSDADDVKLGDDLTEAYEHYPRFDDLLLPSAADFLQRLSNAVGSVEEAAEETNTDKATVRKAFDLHGVEPSGDGVEESTSDPDVVRLPSGEELPVDALSDEPWTDKLLLAQLLSDGMGVGEIALYLSRELRTQVTESDVREACRDNSLIGTPREEPQEEHRTSGHRASVPKKRSAPTDRTQYE